MHPAACDADRLGGPMAQLLFAPRPIGVGHMLGCDVGRRLFGLYTKLLRPASNVPHRNPPPSVENLRERRMVDAEESRECAQRIPRVLRPPRLEFESDPLSKQHPFDPTNDYASKQSRHGPNRGIALPRVRLTSNRNSNTFVLSP